MSVPVNDTDDAKRGGKHFVVDGVGELSQQDSTKATANDRLPLRRFLDPLDGLSDGLEEPGGRSRGSL